MILGMLIGGLAVGAGVLTHYLRWPWWVAGLMGGALGLLAMWVNRL